MRNLRYFTQARNLIQAKRRAAGRVAVGRFQIDPPIDPNHPRFVHEVRDEDIIDVVIGVDEEAARIEREKHAHEAPIEPGVPESIADVDPTPSIESYGPSRRPRRTTPPPPPQPHAHH
jgi:hypothetical protein